MSEGQKTGRCRAIEVCAEEGVFHPLKILPLLWTNLPPLCYNIHKSPEGVTAVRCQYCGCMDSRVIDSRPVEETNSIRRRRECAGCGRRFTTYEKIEQVPLMVIKKDGRRESFDSMKIKSGIIHACDKLNVAMEEIDRVTARVEAKAYANAEGEIRSQTIGDLVMDELRSLDDVAYVRFAAVYRKFTDIPTFMLELQKMVSVGKQ